MAHAQHALCRNSFDSFGVPRNGSVGDAVTRRHAGKPHFDLVRHASRTNWPPAGPSRGRCGPQSSSAVPQCQPGHCQSRLQLCTGQCRLGRCETVDQRHHGARGTQRRIPRLASESAGVIAAVRSRSFACRFCGTDDGSHSLSDARAHARGGPAFSGQHIGQSDSGNARNALRVDSRQRPGSDQCARPTRIGGQYTSPHGGSFADAGQCAARDASFA